MKFQFKGGEGPRRMHRFLFHNDRILSLQDVRLSPGQAGLFNGWGVFTTLRIFNGCPFASERHWKRLSIDARRLQIPFNFEYEALLARLRELIQVNEVKNGCARVYFVYNKVGYWCSDESFPVTDVVMYTNELIAREGMVKVCLIPYGRLAARQLAGTKVTSWLDNVWSLEQARHRGFDEAILLNERGEVAECTAANVFCVRNGKVETPPLSSGCLAGVSREILLEIGPAAGIPIIERPLSLQDLYRAEEVFITLTTRNAQAVSQIEYHTLLQAPGVITVRLGQIFSEYVDRYLLEHS